MEGRRLCLFRGGPLTPSLLRGPRRVAASRELLWNLTLKELRTKYRRSFLGWTWSMLNPLATVAIYSLVFGHLFRAEPPVGSPSGTAVYALFLLCGLLPWNFFVLVTTTGMSSVIANAALVRKVAFPREVLVFSNSLHAAVQFSIEMSLLLVVMSFSGLTFLPWLPLIVLQMLILLVFSSGIALAFAAACVYFRDLSYLWQIASQVLFFSTPIVYSEAVVKDRMPTWLASILQWNPVAVFVKGFRRLIYDGRFMGWSNLLTCSAVAVASLALGWTIFTRLSRRFAEEV